MEGSTNLKCKARFISNKVIFNSKQKTFSIKKSTMLHTLSWVVAESIIKSTYLIWVCCSHPILREINPKGNQS